jgi:hypothetical protein
MPRAMYKGLRDRTRKNPNPIFITSALTATTSKQVTDYVLCADCERRFDKHGEAYMMPMIGKGSRFPLRDRMKVAIPAREDAESVEYSGATLGIDTDKLGYFALSMVWRGAVHEWRGPFGEKLNLLDLAGMQEPVRQYLCGQAAFPDAAIVVRVCNDRTSREALLMPSSSGDQYGPSFEMFVLGVHFFVLLGNTIEPSIRNVCCVTSKSKPLFRGDCARRLLQHLSMLEKTSRRSKAVEAEWP